LSDGVLAVIKYTVPRVPGKLTFQDLRRDAFFLMYLTVALFFGSRTTPYTILHASNVMNYAFFRIIGFYIGQNFIKRYSSAHYVDKGKELASITEKNYTDSHEGDNVMIEKWAAFVNISDWFKWRGFEDVPSDYGQGY
jgi:hypothetical protein